MTVMDTVSIEVGLPEYFTAPRGRMCLGAPECDEFLGAGKLSRMPWRPCMTPLWVIRVLIQNQVRPLNQRQKPSWLNISYYLGHICVEMLFN